MYSFFRFAVVVFGGDGVFNEPRILLTNSQEDFSSNKQIVTNVFTHIPIGKKVFLPTSVFNLTNTSSIREPIQRFNQLLKMSV